ncbi:MAG: Ig-like domain-containing protein [Candidatus Edwardsbacteria bacterium]|nr:Ig-like domain-containing protein [Candidatus Edwardsbacteria bacterium]
MKRHAIIVAAFLALSALPAAARHGLKGQIDLLASLSAPAHLCYNPDANKVYCSLTGMAEEGVAVIDAGAETYLTKVGTGGLAPGELVYAAGSGRVFTHDNGTRMWAINGTTNAVDDSLMTGQGESDLAYNPAQDKVYVADHIMSGLQIYNSSTLAPLGSFTEVRGDLLYAAPLGKLFGIANGRIYGIDGATDAIVDSSEVINAEASSRMAYNAANGKLYVTVPLQNEVRVIDAATNTVDTMFLMGLSITDIAYCPRDSSVYASTFGVAKGGKQGPSLLYRFTAGDSLADYPLDDGVQQMAYNPVDSLLYLLCTNGPGMMMRLFDPALHAVVENIDLVGSGGYRGLAVDAQGDVYTADYNLGMIYVVGRVPNVMWRSNPATNPGNWFYGLDWEICTDGSGSTWAQNTDDALFPTAADSAILVQAGDTMQVIMQPLTVDQLAVDGTLYHFESILTVNDGPGVDVMVNGVFDQSTMTCYEQPVTSQWVYGPGALHNYRGDGDSIPIATWDDASVLDVRIDNASSFKGGIGQSFGIIDWNWSSSFGFTVATEPGFTARQLNVISTGGISPLVICSNTVPSVTLGGLTIQSGGDVVVGRGGAKTLTINGDLQMLNSPPLRLHDPSDPAICTLRVRGNYVYMIAKGAPGKGWTGPAGPDSAAVIFDGGGTHDYMAGSDGTTGFVDIIVEPGNTLQAAGPVGLGSQGRFVLMPGAILSFSDPLGAWVAADSGCIRNSGPRIFGPNAGFIVNESTGPILAGDAVAGTVSMLHAGNSFGTTLLATVSVIDSLLLQGPLAFDDTLAINGTLQPLGGVLGYKGGAVLRIAPGAGDIVLPVMSSDTLGTLSIERPATVFLAGDFQLRRRLDLANGVLDAGGNSLIFGDSILIARTPFGSLANGIPSFQGVASLSYGGGGTIISGPELPADPAVLWDLAVTGVGDTLVVDTALTVNGTLGLNGTLVVNNADVTINGPVNAGAAAALDNPGGATTIALLGGTTAPVGLPKISGHHLMIDRPAACQMQAEVQLGRNLRLMQGSLSVGANALVIGDSLEIAAGGLVADSTSVLRFGFGTGSNLLPGSVIRLDSLVMGNPYPLMLAAPVQIRGGYRQQAGRLLGAGLTYGPAGSLWYEKIGVDTTSDVEFPAAGGPSRLVLNSPASLSLHASRTITGAFGMWNGRLATGANLLAVGPGATFDYVAGIVDGRLSRFIQPGALQTVTYPMGDTALSSPATVTLYNVTTGGQLECSAVNQPHPQVDSAASCLQRYWRFAPSTVACDSAQVALNYTQHDFAAGFTEPLHEGAMVPGVYDGDLLSWWFPAVAARDTGLDSDGGSITLGGIGPFANALGLTAGRDAASIHTVIAADTTGPSILAAVPPDGATSVALNASVAVTFTEAIDTALFAYSFNPNPGGLTVGWTPDSLQATFSHVDLAPLTTYTVSVLSAPDTAGNPLDTTIVPGSWSFTTGAAPDTTPPAAPESLQIYGFNPSYWLSGPTANVPVGWINPVDPTGIVRAYFKAGSPPASNDDCTDTILMVGGTRDTFWLPVATLNGVLPVYLWLRDGAGNLNYLNNSQVVARRDTVPPADAAVKPFAADTTFATAFAVNWSPGTDALSGIQAWRVLSRIDTSAAWDTLAPFTNDTTFSLAGALPGHRYYFEAAACDSAYNFEDVTGTAEASIFVALPAVDTIPPAIVSSTPADGATGVAANATVSILFSEPIRSSTFAYTVSPDPGGLSAGWSADSTTVTIGHAAFSYSTVYTVRVTAAQDTAGLPLAGVDSFRFVTVAVGDTVAPYIAATDPADGAAAVALGATVSIQFSEPMLTAPFSYTISPNPGGVTEAWSADSTSLTIGHNPFALSTRYTVRITSAQDTMLLNLAGPDSFWFTTVALDTMATAWGGGVWKLWSAPLQPQDSSAAAVLGDDLGAYSDTTWRLVGYKPSSGYIERPAIAPGYGYWLASAGSAVIDVQGIPLSGAHATALDSGWNIVGDPFDVAVALSGMRVRWHDGASHELSYADTMVNGVLRQLMWDYLDNSADLVNNGWWDTLAPAPPGDSLRPWRGCAVYAVRPCSLLVDRAAKGSGMIAPPVRSIRWQLELSAAMGSSVDRGLRLGVSPQASACYDRLDAEKPPLVSGGLSLSIPHHDWGQGPCRSYLRDFRPPGAEQRWLLRVDATGQAPVQVDFSLAGALEPEYELYIVNSGLGQAQRVTGAGSVQLAGGGELAVVYTSRGLPELGLEPLAFGLTRIHPNPFRGRTVISYQLDRPGPVSLKVYNSLGQLTATLVDGHREAGFHAASWDGGRTASGIYLVRLESGGRSRITKTVKLR